MNRAEADGESFWSTHFDKHARMKVLHAFNDACGEQVREKYADVARGLILRDEGLPYLRDSRLDSERDLRRFILTGDDGLIPSAIEAVARTLPIPAGRMGSSWAFQPDAEMFTQTVNTVLSEHRIAFELIEGEMVPLASQELHANVVAPTLRLLSGRSGWEKVEAAYQDALDELAEGKPADAITDAATALQEALVALGCKGNALGPLTKDARSKGLYGPHDAPMTDMLDKLVRWVSADRSAKGDAHQVAQPAAEDAWLTVHIVGALILRLTGPSRA